MLTDEFLRELQTVRTRADTLDNAVIRAKVVQHLDKAIAEIRTPGSVERDENAASQAKPAEDKASEDKASAGPMASTKEPAAKARGSARGGAREARAK